MIGMAATSFHNSCRAVEHLINHFGLDQLVQLEQTDENIFRARLAGGGYSMCVLQADGHMDIRDIEPVV